MHPLTNSELRETIRQLLDRATQNHEHFISRYVEDQQQALPLVSNDPIQSAIIQNRIELANRAKSLPTRPEDLTPANIDLLRNIHVITGAEFLTNTAMECLEQYAQDKNITPPLRALTADKEAAIIATIQLAVETGNKIRAGQVEMHGILLMPDGTKKQYGNGLG
jgi:hypothetical protein